MERQDKERRRIASALIVVTIVSLVIGASYFILFRKNKMLQASYQNLYKKNQEILQLEEEYKRPHLEEKYKGSPLKETDKQWLFDKIQQVLATSKEIYGQEFSLQRLSEMVGASYKKVSQVINEKAGQNFNNLLNDYRVKEACKRMNEPES